MRLFELIIYLIIKILFIYENALIEPLRRYMFAHLVMGISKIRNSLAEIFEVKIK